MYKPEPLTFRRIEDGDTGQFIMKMDEHQAALEAFSRQAGEMVDSIQQELDKTLASAEEIRQQTEQLQQNAGVSAGKAADSEAKAKRYRDEAEGISQGQLPKGETGDTLIQGEDGIYRPGKIQSTVAVECSVSGAELAAAGQSYQINLSGRSRHVDGIVTSFRVEWWDGSAEILIAQNGLASTSRTVDVENGLTISIKVTAVDDVGNESRPAILSADVADLTIAPATVATPENGAGYIFDAQPWPLKVTTSDFFAYSPDKHSETQMQVRDANTMELLTDDTFSAQEDLTKPSASTESYARTLQSVDVRVRHAGEQFGWGPWGAWSRVTIGDQVGELVITEVGSQIIQLPPGLRDTVSAVCVARGTQNGGALRWSNVVPLPIDRRLSVVIGSSSSVGEHMAVSNGSNFTGGEGGGAGGTLSGSSSSGSAGGAGGYTGKGGNGSTSAYSSGDDGIGGAGGGSGYNENGSSISGGGVGLYGEGISGDGGQGRRKSGSPGSISELDPASGYGRGSTLPGNRGAGAIRLMWGGGRSFPDNAAYIDISTYNGGA